MASYLMDAVLTALRTSQAATAFGDTFSSVTGTGTQKFSADFAASPDLPYLVATENVSDRQYMSRGPTSRPFIDHGVLSLVLVSDARDDVRDLGLLVAGILNDRVFTWSNSYETGRTFYFSLSSPPSPIPVLASAEGSPVQFQLVLNFDYMTQGAT